MIFKIFQDDSENGHNNQSNQSIDNNQHEYLHEKQSMIRSMAVSHRQGTISKKSNNLHTNQAEGRRIKSDIKHSKNKVVNEESLTWKDLAYNII